MTLEHAKTIARNNKSTYGGKWRIITAAETLWIQMETETSKLPDMPDAQVVWSTDEDEWSNKNDS
jgi:hypothetical protein